MKKMFALMLSGMMAMSVPAMAETAEATAEPETELVAEAAYEGEWITISSADGVSMDMLLPEGWQSVELTEDDAAAGLIFQAYESAAAAETADAADSDDATDSTESADAAGAAESERGFAVSHELSDEAQDAETIQQALAGDYEDAAVVTLNGTDCVKYTDPDSDAVVLVVPDATGMSLFTFTPASDADFAALVDQIIETISVNEAAAE